MYPFLLPPNHSLQEKQFFLSCTKIIEEDTSTPHTLSFRLSQMYHNRYMPVFTSVSTNKALKKFKSLFYVKTIRTSSWRLRRISSGGCKSISCSSKRKNRKQHTTTTLAIRASFPPILYYHVPHIVTFPSPNLTIECIIDGVGWLSGTPLTSSTLLPTRYRQYFDTEKNGG